MSVDKQLLGIFKKYKIGFIISEFWISSNYSRKIKPQGWKLHISANPDNLIKIAKIAIPILKKYAVSFKIVKSIDTLVELNSDVSNATQIGKAITIYPDSDNQAVKLANELQINLASFVGPKIPTDCRVIPGNIVQFRYGSFTNVYIDKFGKPVGFIRDKLNRRVLDKKTWGYIPPKWVVNPFKVYTSKSRKSKLSKYKIYGYILKPFKIIYLDSI